MTFSVCGMESSVKNHMTFATHCRNMTVTRPRNERTQFRSLVKADFDKNVHRHTATDGKAFRWAQHDKLKTSMPTFDNGTKFLPYKTSVTENFQTREQFFGKIIAKDGVVIYNNVMNKPCLLLQAN